MQSVLKILKNAWVVQGIGILALALLLWFAGPLIAVAGRVPLEADWVRGAAVAALVVGWVIFQLVAELRAARKEREFASALAVPGEAGAEAAEESSENVDLLRHNFAEALRLLGERGAGKGGSGRERLYELPWYIIVGPPGSGKSTALFNSGLKFPLAGSFGRQPMPGLGGTRNCEWFFADDAILIDTAGRYVTQDSHKARDAAEWGSFLDLLKRYRPRRPINGALVAMSVSDLLLQTAEERDANAKAIRSRVQELTAKLGIRFPVYVLLTKCDLLAGFNEFFADFDEERRAQVFGETFPAEAPAGAGTESDPLAAFPVQFDELVQRLDRSTLQRMQETRDLQRRSLILDFPQQLALIKPALLAFLDTAFATSRWETRPLLRGIYLTSGTQEGTTIDRVMGLLASSLGVGRQAVAAYSGRGKSFFLTRLLQEVIFPEAELAGTDPKVERRRRWLQGAAYAGLAAVAAGGIGLLALSYQRNAAAVDEVHAQLEAFRAAKLDPATVQSNLRSLVLKLDALRVAQGTFDDYGLAAHFGLYQGDKLGQAAGNAYQHWLNAAFLPLIARNLADRMTGPEGANPDVLYELLKVYLMLGQPERMNPKAAAPWILSDWERAFAAEPETLVGLSRHLDALLAERLDPVALDQNLVATARSRLTQIRPEVQLNARFRNQALLDKSHDFNLGQALGPAGSRVFVTASGQDISSLTIPGLYTAWGYANQFLARSLAFARNSAEGNWVLGREAGQDPARVRALHRDLQNLYLADYRKAWSDLLGGLRMRRAADVTQTVGLLEVLADEKDNPLRKLLQAVKDNTELSKASVLKPVGEPPPGAAGALAGKLEEGAGKVLDLARQAGAGDGAADAVLALEAAFRDQTALLGAAPGQPGGLDGTLKALAALRDQFLVTANKAAEEQALKSPPASGADVQKTKAELARLPPPFNGWLTGLAAAGSSQTESGLRGAARKELNALLKAAVTAPCKSAIAGRYPFAAGSRNEVALLDFTKLFGPNGILDQFFQTHLKTLVDVTRPDWAELSQGPASLGLASAGIRQFQYAARIRAAFFATGSPGPAVAFQLKPVFLDADLARFRLVIEGQEVLYEHGPEQVFPMQWPGANVGSGARLVFETPDGRQASRSFDGPWAWFRMLDGSALRGRGAPELFGVDFRADGHRAGFELRAGSVNNPFNLPELRQFSCPEAL